MKLHKDNIFQKYLKDPEYRRLLQQERELLDIAIRIAETRKKKRLTQVQLARKVNMPQSQIARIESGSHNITLGTLHKVASALDLKVKVAA